MDRKRARDEEEALIEAWTAANAANLERLESRPVRDLSFEDQIKLSTLRSKQNAQKYREEAQVAELVYGTAAAESRKRRKQEEEWKQSEEEFRKTLEQSRQQFEEEARQRRKQEEEWTQREQDLIKALQRSAEESREKEEKMGSQRSAAEQDFQRQIASREEALAAERAAAAQQLKQALASREEALGSQFQQQLQSRERQREEQEQKFLAQLTSKANSEKKLQDQIALLETQAAELRATIATLTRASQQAQQLGQNKESKQLNQAINEAKNHLISVQQQTRSFQKMLPSSKRRTAPPVPILRAPSVMSQGLAGIGSVAFRDEGEEEQSHEEEQPDISEILQGAPAEIPYSAPPEERQSAFYVPRSAYWRNDY